MRSVVLGTAGHIDHGKTTLVKALTGVDTDRLREEKERGITIELGFAPLELPADVRAGVVDVPGHERFVRTMVAGAGGIDAAMLVVAAPEGVMPQTREHLAVCNLLGIGAGLVALNKADLVEPDFLALAIEDVRDAVRGTFLEGAPIVPVSATTGEGLDALRTALSELVTSLPGRDPTGPLRLPIDRSFPMKGFGAVVTGTLVSGRIEVGQAVEILPSGIGAKVRGLQIHGTAVQRAEAGTRVAVNLQGVETGEVPRWEWLTRAGELVPTRQLDVRIELLAGCTRPLRLRSTLQLHIGTATVTARVVLLDRTELAPGESGYARLRLDRGIAALPGDRFILRGDNSLAPYGGTVGGGTVLRPLASGYRRRADAAARARAYEEADPATRVGLELEWVGVGGRDRAEIHRLVAPDPNAAIAEAKKRGLALEVEAGRYVHPSVAATTTRLALEAIARHHETRPLESGMPRQELRSRLPAALPARLFDKVLSDLAASGQIVAEREVVRLPTHAPQAKEAGGELMESIAKVLVAAKLQPPRIKELPDVVHASLKDVQSALKLLVQGGRVVRVNDELYFAKEEIDRLRIELVRFLEANGSIDAQKWKEITNASRKYMIPLGEFFDSEKLTLRVGDTRQLRGRK